MAKRDEYEIMANVKTKYIRVWKARSGLERTPYRARLVYKSTNTKWCKVYGRVCVV